MTIGTRARALNCSASLYAQASRAVQRFVHGIELWLPQDVSDITLVSKASLVRELEPLRIKSDGGDCRYKNKIRYPARTRDATGKTVGEPRKQACVLKNSWPGSRHPGRAALPAFGMNTPALRPGRRPWSQLGSELGTPAAGKTPA